MGGKDHRGLLPLKGCIIQHSLVSSETFLQVLSVGYFHQNHLKCLLKLEVNPGLTELEYLGVRSTNIYQVILMNT